MNSKYTMDEKTIMQYVGYFAVAVGAIYLVGYLMKKQGAMIEGLRNKATKDDGKGSLGDLDTVISGIDDNIKIVKSMIGTGNRSQIEDTISAIEEFMELALVMKAIDLGSTLSGKGNSAADATDSAVQKLNSYKTLLKETLPEVMKALDNTSGGSSATSAAKSFF